MCIVLYTKKNTLAVRDAVMAVKRHHSKSV
jgi:hypothetical protein